MNRRNLIKSLFLGVVAYFVPAKGITKEFKNPNYKEVIKLKESLLKNKDKRHIVAWSLETGCLLSFNIIIDNASFAEIIHATNFVSIDVQKYNQRFIIVPISNNLGLLAWFNKNESEIKNKHENPRLLVRENGFLKNNEFGDRYA